jgi:choline kinase
MENGKHEPVRDAVILMAGVGSRLGEVAKPLIEIAGRPLVSYTFEALARAGVRDVHVVLGAHSERLEAEVHAFVPPGIGFHTISNPQWQKQNGVSVLCAAGKVRAPFFLTMGDHLFEFAILEALLSRSARTAVNLAVDRDIAGIFDLDDATKVTTQDDRIVAIGKDLAEYDAIDTGVFLCSERIFDYLRRAQRNADCSLSDGVRAAGAEGQAFAVDINGAWWQDVDTPEMLARAEEMSARLLREGSRGLAEEGVTGQDGVYAGDNEDEVENDLRPTDQRKDEKCEHRHVTLG